MKKLIRQEEQTQMIHWSLWYFFLTTCVIWTIGGRYLLTIFPLQLPYIKKISESVVYAFLFISYVSHLAFLSFLVWLFIVYPFIYCFPKRIIVFPVAIFSTTVLIFFIVIDSNLFQLYRFHLNSTLFNLLLGGGAQDVFGFSLSEWLMGVTCIVAILLLQSGLCVFSWRKFEHWRHGKRIIITMISGLCLSYYCLIITSAKGHFEYVQQTIALPYYKDVLLKLIPARIILSDIEQINRDKYLQPRQSSAELRYPLNPLECTPVTKPYNIVLIVIDTWRFTTLQEKSTPHLKDFSKNSLNFAEHFSGGNSTQAGMFSLFYSLPINYWTAMIDQNQGPLLIKTMLEHHYETAIHWSGEMIVPAFDKTLFHDIHPLEKKTSLEKPIENDQYITEKALQFLDKHDPNRPFFLFTLYLTAHHYCETDKFPAPFQPSIKNCNRLLVNNATDPLPYFNRYRNALMFVDGQIGRILDALKESNLYDNTVVIITGDHGEEFNDNHNNYWFHASSYSDFQLKTPMLIKWPKTPAKQLTHFTSHYDLVPTLLQRVFHCNNPASDYGLGHDLFAPHKENYFLASSYVNSGIISKERVMVLSPEGDIVVQDRKGNQIKNAMPDVKLIKEALGDMRAFYAK
jgi:membrane-anchored protein YejM (alkaline phosphatase superfamily)